MGFKPTVQLESRRGADGCRWDIIRVGGAWSVRVFVQATNGEYVERILTQAEVVAGTTLTERQNTQSLLDKLQNLVLQKAGWVDDTNPDPP